MIPNFAGGKANQLEWFSKARLQRDIREARVFVGYPVLRQNLHKLPPVTPFVNSSEVTKQRVYFLSWVLALLRR